MIKHYMGIYANIENKRSISALFAAFLLAQICWWEQLGRGFKKTMLKIGHFQSLVIFSIIYALFAPLSCLFLLLTKGNVSRVKGEMERIGFNELSSRFGPSSRMY